MRTQLGKVANPRKKLSRVYGTGQSRLFVPSEDMWIVREAAGAVRASGLCICASASSKRARRPAVCEPFRRETVGERTIRKWLASDQPWFVKWLVEQSEPNEPAIASRDACQRGNGRMGLRDSLQRSRN